MNKKWNFRSTKPKSAMNRVKIIFAMAAFVAMSACVKAQALGVGISNPQAHLHVHSTDGVGDIPTDPNPGGGLRDSILPPPPNPNEVSYYTTLLVTNNNTGSEATDGLLLRQFDNDVTISQQENGFLKVENGNTVFKMTSSGVGIGDTYQGVMFNVVGKARFTQEVNVVGGLVCGAFRVSDGLYCDANGNLEVKHLKVTMNVWPDYVFDNGYTLMPLGELEKYISRNNHMPGVPSAEDVEKDGSDLGEMNRILMEKVEELTLYIIDLQKQIDELKKRQIR